LVFSKPFRSNGLQIFYKESHFRFDLEAFGVEGNGFDKLPAKNPVREAENAVIPLEKKPEQDAPPTLRE